MKQIIKDRMKGPWCQINGKYAYDTFGADLKEITSNQGSIDATYIKHTGKSSLLLINEEIAIPTYIFTFYVVGENEEQCDINSSNLISECQDCIISTGSTGFEYVGILTNYTITKTGIEWYNEVSLTIAAIKRLPLEKILVKDEETIFVNKGSIHSGLRIRIFIKENLNEITVGDTKIYDLSKNSEFVIDGINGEVLYNGVNALLKTDLINFPKVNRGHNKFLVSSLDNVSIVLEYYPTLVI